MRQFIKLIEVNALLLTIKKMGVNMKRIQLNTPWPNTFYNDDGIGIGNGWSTIRIFLSF